MTFFGRFRRRRIPLPAHRKPEHVDVLERARKELERPVSEQERREWMARYEARIAGRVEGTGDLFG